MNLDTILHAQKNFAELDDADVEGFLRKRSFGTEHLNLEFNSQFPQRTNKKYVVKGICKYIVGCSNEEGGIVIYGVSDDIKKPAVTFSDYLAGLSDRMREFIERHRYDFSETLRYSRNVEVFQDGVSVGYFPKAIRQDAKSTSRTTLYKDGTQCNLAHVPALARH